MWLKITLHIRIMANSGSVMLEHQLQSMARGYHVYTDMWDFMGLLEKNCSQSNFAAPHALRYCVYTTAVTRKVPAK